MVRVMNSNTTGEINPEIIQERLYSPDTTDATRRAVSTTTHRSRA